MQPSRPKPLSPHLSVYRLVSFAAGLSITHRITGVALYAGAILLVVWIGALAYGRDSFEAVDWFVTSWFGYLILFGWTLALFYHLFNGIRHLFWDMGKGFELPTMRASGMAVLAGTAACTLLAWIIGFAV